MFGKYVKVLQTALKKLIQDIEIDIGVLMNQNISKTGNLGKIFSEFFIQDSGIGQ